jgi:thermitase
MLVDAGISPPDCSSKSLFCPYPWPFRARVSGSYYEAGMNMRLMRLVGFARLALSATLTSLAYGAAGADTPRPSEFASGEVLIGVTAGAGGERAAGIVAGAVGEVVGGHPALGAYRVKLAPGISVAAAVSRLKARTGLRYVEPNYIRRASSTPNDTSYASEQWAPQKVQADLSWDVWNPQARVVIAIVDTGIDYTHPDLSGVIYKDAGGSVIGINVQTGQLNGRDDEGHGTHCAGIAAAQINNSTGIAGIAGWNPNRTGSGSYVRLMPVKVLDSTGAGTDADVADGIIWAVDHGAHVISLSLGGPDYSQTLNNAVQYAWGKGCVVVSAAGNESTSSYSYPAAYANVISVAATNSGDQLASFSNYGSWVKTAAPGVNIYSTYIGGGYGTASGTSMACPLVAGEAAAIRAHNPSLTNADINRAITTNIDPYFPYQGRTLGTGTGRVNVFKALQSGGTQPHPNRLSFNWNPIRGGNTVTGTVTLDGAAPAGGVVVTLTSANAAVQTPATVTVAAGMTTANFSVTTQAVASVTSVNVSAQVSGVGVTTSLALWPAAPEHMTFNPVPVRGGNQVTGTIHLNGKAPAGGIVVSLGSETPSVATPAATVTVPAGSSTGTFTVATYPVNGPTLAIITAFANGVQIRIGFNVTGAAPEHISFNPNPARGGRTVTATLLLNGKAPTGGLTVTLNSENTGLAQVPASIAVPAGQSSATFLVNTSGVAAPTMAVVGASANGVAIRIGLDLQPAVPEHIQFDPGSVKGGGSVTGTLILNGKAPAAGLVVSLNSENPGLAQAPATVTVPGGSDRVSFTVTTSPVVARALAVIGARANGNAIRIGFDVTP